MHLPTVVFLSLFVSSVASGQTDTISTFAGGGMPTNIPGASASLLGPQYIAADQAGDLFFVEQGSVMRLDATTGVLTVVAGNGTTGFSGDNGLATSAQLLEPAGVAVDSIGNLYIADAGNNRVRKVTNGVITTVAGNGTAGYSGDNGPATSARLNNPVGLAVDAAGNVYIVDLNNVRVRKLSNGVITTAAGNGYNGFSGDGGSATNASLNITAGIAVDSSANIYIADGGNDRVRKVSNGVITTVAGNGTEGYSGDNGPATSAELGYPVAVAVDTAGNLYVTDFSNQRIRIVSNGVIATAAGNGDAGYSGDGGPAASASLNFPMGIAAGPAGSVYVADVDNNRIRKVANGVIITVAGTGTDGYSGDGGPATSAQLIPVGIASDSVGNLYIADTDNNCIRKVAKGVITTVAGTGTQGYSGDGGPAISAQLDGPEGVTVDSAGNLYIADTGNNTIRKVANGLITTVAGNAIGGYSGDNGPATSAQLLEPSSVAVDSASNLYIADSSNNRIRKVSNGVIATVAGGGALLGDNGAATSALLFFPGGMALDSAGNLYIADTLNYRIRMVSNGVITTVAGNGTQGFSGDNGPATSAQLYNPDSVAIDSAGNLYIADTLNYRIRKVSNGVIATVAGNGTQGFSGDSGPATTAQLDVPEGVAVDFNGNLYIADWGNNRVRLVAPPGSPTQHQLTISALPSAAGTVTPATGTLYNAGTVVPITATPSAGYTFSGWTGSVASATSAATTVTMSAAESITALFSGTPAPLVTMSMSPSSGGDPQQLFTFQVSDSLAATDLTTVGVLFNTSASAVSACTVMYNQPQNALTLLTDAGAAPASSIAPGSGSQQNSQCTLNGAGSSVTTSGNTLTLNLSLSFQASWVGPKTVYMEAVNPYQSGTWLTEGRWVTSASLTLSESPSSGSGTQATFTIQASDSWGATDVSAMGILFNTTTSLAGACAVTYNWAQNTLALLTDAGLAPASSIVPGSGTQHNSQCTLNGSGSTITVVGTVMTLNVSLTFQQAFAGTKNVYVDASDPFHAASWTSEGVWAVPQGVGLSVTPSSGSASQQTFSLQISDALGAADLTTVGILFSTSSSATGACAVTYNQSQNALTLLTDTGTAPAGSIAPGSGSQQNSQCTLSGSGSSVTASGNTLTLSLAIAFQPAFSGAKNLYLEAGSSFQAANWTLEGTWTPAPLVTMTMSPSSGGDPQQLFTFQVSDSLAATDLTTVGVLFNTSASAVSACTVMYNQPQNALMLLTDAGAAPASSIAPGSGSQQNSQCTLNGAGSSVTTSGNTLTLNLSLSFQASWVGPKTVYMEAVNPYQSGTWLTEGRWVTSASLTLSESPSSGSGTQATFTIQASDSWGATDVSAMGILFNTTTSLAGACAVTYNWAQNTLALLTDAGLAPASSIVPGSGTQHNSQCTLNGSGSTITVVGTVMTLNVSLTFQQAFAGTKNVYVEASDPFHAASWTSEGVWAVPQGVGLSVTPSSGSASQQTFSLQISDALGAADLTTVGILFSTSSSATGACAVTYNQSQNALTLLTDTGTAPAGSIAPGSGSQQNSQCTLSGSGSSVTASGNTLTLSLAIAFQPAFSGAKNLYLEAGSSFQAANWTLEGTWTPAPLVTMTMSPSSGGGPQQLFTFQVSDSLAATDLTTVGVLFNTSASAVSACTVMYNQPQNALTLLTDAGAAPASSIAPGSGSQQNSQCTLNGAGSSVTTSGNTLTLNLSLSFQASWVGPKTVYMEAVNPYQSGTWLTEGRWVTSASLTLSESPSSGSGTQATFTIQASDSWGATDVSAMGILFNTTTSLAGACAVTYNWAQNTLALLTDAGLAPASSIVPGSGTQQNSQCMLNGSGSTVTVVGTVMTLNVSLTFQQAFAGTKNVYVEASDPFHAASWTSEGTWNASLAAGPN